MKTKWMNWLSRGFLFSLSLSFLLLALLLAQATQAQVWPSSNADVMVRSAAGVGPGEPAVFVQPLGLADEPPQGGNPAQLPEGEAGASDRLTDHPDGLVGGEVSMEPAPSNPEAMAMFAGDPESLEMVASSEVEIASVSVGPPLVIPAADFRSDGFKPEGFMFWFHIGALEGENVFGTCLMAPAYLPNNRIVKSLFASALDNDVGSIIKVDLWRVDNYSGAAAQVMATAMTTSNSSLMQLISDDTINYPQVVYPDYSYYVTTCLEGNGATNRLYSVRIYFE